MVGMFLRCAAQFERRYILGEVIPPGIAARRGSATHEAIRVNHLQKVHSGEDLPVNALQDAARDEYVKLVREEGVFIPKEDVGQKTELLNEGLNAAISLTGLYHQEVAPAIKPALVEERIEIDAGLPLIISCGIDCYTADKWLPDFKTADKSKNQADADNSLQLTFYAGAVADRIGEWPEKISLEVLVNNIKPKHQSLITKRGPQDWAQLMLRLQLIITQIYSGLFPPCDPSSWACDEKWCGYALTCKYYRKRK